MLIANSKLAELIREHLPEDLAERYLAILRPAFGLGEDAQGPVVGRRGGLPLLPSDLDWPVGPGDDWRSPSPLAFVSEIDLRSVPRGVLDIPLPDSGTLLFFCDDGHIGNNGFVEEERPYGPGNAQVLYVPHGTAVRERPAPVGITPYDHYTLRAEPVVTEPNYAHPVLAQALVATPRSYDHPVWSGYPAYSSARYRYEPADQFPARLGGYAFSWHTAPEATFDDWESRLEEGASDAGTLLAQFSAIYLDDSDGLLNWLIRPSALAAKNFQAAGYLWGNG